MDALANVISEKASADRKRYFDLVRDLCNDKSFAVICQTPEKASEEEKYKMRQRLVAAGIEVTDDELCHAIRLMMSHVVGGSPS